jgi:hypothetical protein
VFAVVQGFAIPPHLVVSASQQSNAVQDPALLLQKVVVAVAMDL